MSYITRLFGTMINKVVKMYKKNLATIMLMLIIGGITSLLSERPCYASFLRTLPKRCLPRVREETWLAFLRLASGRDALAAGLGNRALGIDRDGVELLLDYTGFGYATTRPGGHNPRGEKLAQDLEILLESMRAGEQYAPPKQIYRGFTWGPLMNEELKKQLSTVGAVVESDRFLSFSTDNKLWGVEKDGTLDQNESLKKLDELGAFHGICQHTCRFCI